MIPAYACSRTSVKSRTNSSCSSGVRRRQLAPRARLAISVKSKRANKICLSWSRRSVSFAAGLRLGSLSTTSALSTVDLICSVGSPANALLETRANATKNPIIFSNRLLLSFIFLATLGGYVTADDLADQVGNIRRRLRFSDFAARRDDFIRSARRNEHEFVADQAAGANRGDHIILKLHTVAEPESQLGSIIIR